MTYIDRPERGVTRITGGSKEPVSLRAWPVGSIFFVYGMDTPADLLGGGVWTRFAAGRVLVGYNAFDEDFNTIGEMEGQKEVTLEVDNLPPHTHEAGTLNATTAGEHVHGVDRRDGTGSTAGFARGSATEAADYDTAQAGAHGHDVEGSTASTGSSEPVNNMPPYIVVAMWRRTA